MTAEVAVVNKSAVALATDSAVTIGNSGKVYNSANKLFALSKFQPVGVMIYGNAEFMGIPWETIIKEYRASLAKRSFASLQEYSVDFFKFVSSAKIFSSSFEGQFVIHRIRDYFIGIREEASQKASEQIKSKNEISVSETNDLFRQVIFAHYHEWLEYDTVDSFSNGGISEFIKTNKKIIDRLINDTFERVSLRKSDKANLSEIAARLFGANRFPSNTSGIVLAGFGASEVFPSVLAYDCDRKVGDKLKYAYQARKSVTIQEDNDAAVIPFAQSEMVGTFMEGIDPILKSKSDDYLTTLFQDYPATIISGLSLDPKQSQELINKLRDQTSKLHDGYKEFMKKYQARAHVGPIVDMVAVLPKDELATMAEALVNLTSFKRKVTAETETVGGPVDVAVISKGDGLIWIKRKHYFDPDLNHHFFANYYRENKI